MSNNALQIDVVCSILEHTTEHETIAGTTAGQEGIHRNERL